MEGGFYVDRTDWWDDLAEMPAPHIVVIEDADRRVGTAAFVGEIHAAILQAMGCVAVVTNGAVRDLEQVERLGFQLFSGNVSVSHAYAHVAKVDTPVRVAGLNITTGRAVAWRPARDRKSSARQRRNNSRNRRPVAKPRRGNSSLLSVRSIFARRTAKSSAPDCVTFHVSVLAALSLFHHRRLSDGVCRRHHQSRTHAGRSVSINQDSGRGGRDVFFRHAARADRK